MKPGSHTAGHKITHIKLGQQLWTFALLLVHLSHLHYIYIYFITSMVMLGSRETVRFYFLK